MQNVEDAYRILQAELISFVAEDQWDAAGSVMTLVGNMTQTSYWRKHKDVLIENDRFPPLGVASSASRAALYLRDDLLKKRGDRIWGLTFTLLPTGKFKLDYDYNKPEGYDETDETVNLDDAVDRLKKMGVKVEVTHKTAKPTLDAD